MRIEKQYNNLFIRSNVCVSVLHLHPNHWSHKVENTTILIAKEPGSARSTILFDLDKNIFIIHIDKYADKANMNEASHGLATSGNALIGCASPNDVNTHLLYVSHYKQ